MTTLTTTLLRRQQIILRAIRTVGSLEEVANLYSPKISRQAVAKWISQGYVPSARVRILAEATKMPREELNPDFK